jgi:hypothetical protein
VRPLLPKYPTAARGKQDMQIPCDDCGIYFLNLAEPIGHQLSDSVMSAAQINR